MVLASSALKVRKRSHYDQMAVLERTSPRNKAPGREVKTHVVRQKGQEGTTVLLRRQGFLWVGEVVPLRWPPGWQFTLVLVLGVTWLKLIVWIDPT